VTTNQPASEMLPLWIVKLRAPFFTADLVPVCLGTAIAWARTGAFNVWYFLLTLVGVVCINAGTNMTNDYFDHTWGSDEVNTEFANPFTGGSRLIQMGVVKPKTFLRGHSLCPAGPFDAAYGRQGVSCGPRPLRSPPRTDAG